MGALTSNRKRVDECFSLCNQSTSFDSSNRLYYYRNQIDTHQSKKRRINIQNYQKAIISSPSASTGSRLRRYPEPEKLRREVHAPVRANRFGALSSGSKRSSGIFKKDSMGNALRTIYKQAKDRAVGGLRYVKVLNGKEVIDVEAEPEKENVIAKGREEVEIVEDGHEVRRQGVSDDCRVLKGDELKSHTRELDRKSLRNNAIQGLSVVPDLIQAERAGKVVALDRKAYKELLSSIDRSYSSTKRSTLDSEIELEEARLEAIRSLRKQKEEAKSKELKKPGEGLLREPFVPLTEEEKGEVARAFSNSNRRKILVTHDNSNIQITGLVSFCTA